MARYLVSVVSDPDAATPEVAVQVDGDPDLESVRPCGADLNLVRACWRAGFFRDFAYGSLDLIDVEYVGDRTVEFVHEGETIAVATEEQD